MAFVRFMSSPAGRTLRIVAGLLLMFVGVAFVRGTGGLLLAVVGAVPLLAGALNLCLLAPLFHAPLRGSDLPPLGV
ncbi:MAG TPA: DUF2892 domain-containing protein [Polyangia bacterium]